MYVLFTAMEEYVSNALLETLLSSSSTTEMLSNLVLKMQDDTQEEWYIEGFEDYDYTIAADEDIDEVIDSVRASILYRNKNSADGING